MGRRRGSMRVAALFLLLGGCRSAWRDRLHDAAEIFDLGVTAGPGVELSARATPLLQAGVGAFDGTTVGLLEGRAVAVREQRGEYGVSLLHVYEVRREGAGRLLDLRHPRWADPGYTEAPLGVGLLNDRDRYDVGFDFHLGFVGLRFAAHGRELLDFLTGCFGYDLSKDDAHGRSLQDLRTQARSGNARVRAAAFDALLRRGEGIHGYGIWTVPDVTPPFQRRAMERLAEQ